MSFAAKGHGQGRGRGLERRSHRRGRTCEEHVRWQFHTNFALVLYMLDVNLVTVVNYECKMSMKLTADQSCQVGDENLRPFVISVALQCKMDADLVTILQSYNITV